MKENKYSEVVGKTFGLLRVKNLLKKKDGHWWCLCECACGNEKLANPRKLLAGKTTNCGCTQVLKNGKYHTSYFVWQSMMQRCYNKRNRAYKSYGGSGIKVYKEWQTFEGFLYNFTPRPSKDFTIDRINPNGIYEPQNCRWVHKVTNSIYNKRNTLKEYEIKEIKTFLKRNIPEKKIALFYDVSVDTINRIKKNISYQVEI